MTFLSPEVALYLYKSTICPCMEHRCHIWAGAPSYLELSDKLHNRICKTISPSLATSLESLAHYRNVTSLSLFYWYYFGRCSSALNCFHFLILQGVLLVNLIACKIFLSPFLDVTRMSVNNFFACTARPWNSLPIECFPLTYDLNGFKTRINRQLLTAGSFWRDFLYALIFLCFFFLWLHALQWLFSLARSESQF